MKNFSWRLQTDVPLMSVGHLNQILHSTVSDADIRMSEHPAFTALRGTLAPKLQIVGDVAIAPIQGTLAHNPDAFEILYSGVEDSRTVVAMLNEANDNPKVKGVLLNLYTPGGMLLGGPEMAYAVSALRASGKPVVAFASGLCCSLGYMIASQAAEIIASPSAIVGSIGVISSVTDYTDYLANLGIKIEYFTNDAAIFKGAGAVGSTLTDPQRAQIKASVESAFTMFKDMVQSNRPMVKADAMQGQTFSGQAAKQAGLVDRIGDQNYALAVLRSYLRP